MIAIFEHFFKSFFNSKQISQMIFGKSDQSGREIWLFSGGLQKIYVKVILELRSKWE